jgi:hypothetical protein
VSGAAAGGNSVLNNIQSGGKPLPNNYVPTVVPSFAQALNGSPVNLQGVPVNLQGASIASQLARPIGPQYRGQSGFQDLITPQVNQAAQGARNIDPTVSVGGVAYANPLYNQAAAQSYQKQFTPQIIGMNTSDSGGSYSAPTGHWVGNQWVANTAKPKPVVSNGWN